MRWFQFKPRKVEVDPVHYRVLHKTFIYKAIIVIASIMLLVHHLTGQVTGFANQLYFSNDYSSKTLCNSYGVYVDQKIKVSPKSNISPLLGISNTNYKWIRNDRWGSGEFNNNQTYCDLGLTYSYGIAFTKAQYQIPIGQSLYNKDQRPKVLDVTAGFSIPYKQFNIGLYGIYGRGLGAFRSNLDNSGYNFNQYSHLDSYIGYGISVTYKWDKQKNNTQQILIPQIAPQQIHNYPEIRDWLLKDSTFGIKMRHYIEKIERDTSTRGNRLLPKTDTDENH